MSGLILTVWKGSLIEDIVQEVYNVPPPSPDISYPAWPMAWDLSKEYIQKRLEWELDYSRKLGFEFDYYMLFNQVPFRFKEANPQYKYVDADGQIAQIDPSDPKGRELSKKLYSGVIEKYGTDHMYGSGILGEFSPGDDPVQFKIDGALQLTELLKEIDPALKHWRYDGGWTFTFNAGNIWNKKTVKRFLDALPDEYIYLSDITCDYQKELLCEKYDYFYGKKWAFGIINSLAGDDFLSGDLQHIIEKAQMVVNSPKGNNCIGFNLAPENINTNPFLK